MTYQMEQSEDSKLWITESFFQLLKTTPYQGIRVTDIAKNAGVSRQTFYRHFCGIEQILYEFSVRDYGVLIERLKETKTGCLLSLLRRSFDYTEEHRDVMPLLFRESINYPMFENTTMLYLNEFCPQLTYARKRVITGGSYALMSEWFLSDGKIDKEEAIEALAGLFADM